MTGARQPPADNPDLLSYDLAGPAGLRTVSLARANRAAGAPGRVPPPGAATHPVTSRVTERGGQALRMLEGSRSAPDTPAGCPLPALIS